MEEVQKCNRFPFISEPIELKSFLHGSGIIPPDILYDQDKSLENKIQKYLGGMEFDFDALEEECSFSRINGARTHKIDIGESFKIPTGVNLETLKKQKTAIEAEKPVLDMYDRYFHKLLHPGTFPISDKGIENVQTDAKVESHKIELPEVLLTVQIYRPIKQIYRKNSLLSGYIAVDQEFHVTGQNLLSELRDEIGCVSDHSIPGEFSEDPDMLISGICMKDMYPSGFFYINGVFYNDLRLDDSKDYSKLIIDWATTSDRGIGPFETKSMDEAKFIDLTIRLGYPYVYVHQGKCEHFLVFCDVRLMTEEDSLIRENYPRYSRHISKPRTYCMVCRKQGANWIVTENPRLPETPYFFCDHCFRSFNYKPDGTKIDEFKARKLLDRSLLI